MNKRIDFVIPQNKTESKYVGFNFEEDKARFVFPCQYIEAPKEKVDFDKAKREAKKVLGVIKKIQSDYLYGGKSEELFQFYSMIWLMQDYIDRGYYVERERIVKKATSGRINWKHTIKHSQALMSKGNVVYSSFSRYKNNIDEGQILSQIYKCCLKYSVERLGFMVGLTQTEGSCFSMKESDLRYMQFFLRKELSATFQDYKKTLINHLLSIINGLDGKAKGVGFSVSDEEFEYVFECLIDHVFGTEEVSDYYGKGVYIFGEKEIKSSTIRPDTIMRLENACYIIDAKYYNYGYTKNGADLPDSSSISKQYGYGMYIKKRLEGMRVSSAFLLPFSKENDEESIQRVGYARIDELDEKIAVCLVDLKTLIDVYADGNKEGMEKLKSALIKQINK